LGTVPFIVPSSVNCSNSPQLVSTAAPKNLDFIGLNWGELVLPGGIALLTGRLARNCYRFEITIKPRPATDGTMLDQTRAETGARFDGAKRFQIFRGMKQRN
jgi:hypothetical protein